MLAALLFAGFSSIGPLPPLGPLLDPANGVWSTAASAVLAPVDNARLPGLSARVEVVFDDRGVPHIFAATEDDAYRALGFVVARDRLFQMEAQTRAASGRLTEWAGPRALELDRRSRALGLVWGAERKYAAYVRSSPGFRAIGAYADGVNAWITQMRPRDLPVEYRLLNTRPIAWEPIHSLFFFSRMALTLGFNDASFRRLHAESLVGKAAADALFPVNSPIQLPIQPNGLRTARFDTSPIPQPGKGNPAARVVLNARETLAQELGVRHRSESGDAIGSNSWAVSPRRTASGHALLAGDPHLDLSLPSVWYEMHISVPGKLDVAGAGFPGVPGVVIGFNRDVAWTFTNTGSDVDDYYAETVDDTTHPSRYMVDGKWRDIERRLESYRGTDGAVLRIDTLYFTHRGPMTRRLGEWLSMRWTAYDNSRETDVFMRLGHARNAQEWLTAMEDYVAPTQNGLVADRSGSIAIRSSGRYPARPGDGRGDVIRSGSSSANDWTGSIPLSAYPYSINPAQGYLASANQQPVDPLLNQHYMGSNWYSPWRAMRITQLLQEDSSLTPDKMRRYQTDPGSARADVFVPAFLAAAAARADRGGRGNAQIREAASLLAEWNRRYEKTNRRAVLFEAAMDELSRRTWDELIGDTTAGESARKRSLPESQILAVLLQSPRSVWWDDRRTPAVEDRDAVLTASLGAALVTVTRSHGTSDSDGWLWSKIRTANINHLLQIPAFSKLGIPVQGGPSTLSPSGGDGTQGASWRMVVELGPEVRAWSTYPGGQSGAPSSPRYVDRLTKWSTGQLDRVLFPKTAADIDRARVASRLTLVPR